ncbi:MAG: prepilin-type N-terminal cleavage/methylation domain-containing protein [Desulfobacula sp.]|jgi:prepilin-type N-terminal cleavage/methylation domain-containing protein|nr:prepilin-type N-terminal cleavage/methylation domain-containing protein [Desulfobacula sp.]
MKRIGKYKISNAFGNSNGFSMIEIISVLVIVGILSAVAVSKMSSTDVYDVAMEVEILKSHLRYSQIRSMSHNESWGIKIKSGSSYTLQKSGSTASVNLPNENSPTHTFASGIKATPGTKAISFDDLGSPGSSDIVITLNVKGKNPSKLTITQTTGFIY